MKFTQRTIQLLRNFSSINESIVFYPGSTIRTVSLGNNVFARAHVEFNNEQTFGIYNLGEFLASLSMFNDPDIVPTPSILTIKEGRKRMNYVCTDPKMIHSFEQSGVKLPSADIGFRLESDDFTKLTKALGILKTPEVVVRGDGSVITIGTHDQTKGTSGSEFNIELAETTEDFEFVLSSDKLKMLNEDYDITISKRGLIEFKAHDVTYWVLGEKSSKFN